MDIVLFLWHCKRKSAKLLIEHGASVNTKQDSTGATPLRLAIPADFRNNVNDQVEIIHLLLEKGADPNNLAGDEDGLDALSLAKRIEGRCKMFDREWCICQLQRLQSITLIQLHNS